MQGHKVHTNLQSANQRRARTQKVWRVERLLGTGPQGIVRLEVCSGTNERRAVKRIAPNATKQTGMRALLEFSKPKYKQSGLFLGFLGWFQISQYVYLAMEYLPGGDLEEYTKRSGGQLPEIELKGIIAHVLEGLQIMHLEYSRIVT